MKKIDKLILHSFAATLALTFLVVIFILLNRQLMMYYDDILGKGLEGSIILKFIGYFAVLMIPQALPLAILLAALITFGSLGEHFELSAIKSAGISLPRIIRPVLILVIGLAGFAFYCNNQIVPKAALQAFSLLYDIRQTKPTLDIKEGTFYDGLPDINIKVATKFAEDPAALKDIILYDHQNDRKEVYLADSGRMFTFLNDRYLKFELYNGYHYKEEWQRKRSTIDLSKTKFQKIEMVIDLASFDMSSTDQRLFANHRYMLNMRQLDHQIDSIRQSAADGTQQFKRTFSAIQSQETARPGSSDSIVRAADHARLLQSLLQDHNERQESIDRQIIGLKVQWHRIASSAVACITMLLIGAPLGGIIKKGGLGMPFLISIIFFILFFVCDMQGERMSNRQWIEPFIGMWMGNAFLILMAIYLMHQAKVDGRLFDSDNYSMLISRARNLVARQCSLK